jgi:hypothetical protein
MKKTAILTYPGPPLPAFGQGSIPLEPAGRALKEFYFALNVENGWQAGSHVDWETGIADRPDATAGNHTHCSAFVAAACKRMEIYILRPPEHGQPPARQCPV